MPSLSPTPSSASRRLPHSGNAALAAAALIQLALGTEFALAGLNKLLDADLPRQFAAFVGAQPGARSGVLAPIVSALILPHGQLIAYLSALTELGAGAVLALSAIEVWRRRFSGPLGSPHGYEPGVALLSSAAALAVAVLSGTIYALQGHAPFIGMASAFSSPVAIELFLVPVALGIAWLEFGRFRALRELDARGRA